MKRTVKSKNLIVFSVVLIFLFSITTVPAYAEFPPLTTAGRRLGAFLLSAIQAINITLSSTAAQSPGADIMNYIADPLDVQYSYSEMWEDQPKIQIWKDYISIDGIEYTDIWLSNEAATKFQVDAYDFRSAYNIASQSNGTFVSGYGYYDGNAMFDTGETLRSQTTTIDKPTSSTWQNYGMGNGTLKAMKYNNMTTRYGYVPSAGNASYGNVYSSNVDSIDTWFEMVSNTPYIKAKGDNETGVSLNSSLLVRDPFDFDWVSSTIPAQRILDPNEGMMLRIPSDRIPAIEDFITDNPEFIQPGGAPIDVTIDPDVMTKLDDLIDIIAPIIPIINRIGDVNFTYNHNEPYTPIPDPAPDVDPDTPIDQITYDEYYQTITNQTTFINEGIQNIDNGIQNIQNQNDQIINNQDTIINDSIPEIIENIPKIDEICNNIDTAPYHDLDTGLDHLPSFFLPFITDLRSALGIWHYVTEWISQISTTFGFVTGCLVGTSIMTPIYAAIAGFMCIKVYRRMTS